MTQPTDYEHDQHDGSIPPSVQTELDELLFPDENTDEAETASSAMTTSDNPYVFQQQMIQRSAAAPPAPVESSDVSTPAGSTEKKPWGNFFSRCLTWGDLLAVVAAFAFGLAAQSIDLDPVEEVMAQLVPMFVAAMIVSAFIPLLSRLCVPVYIAIGAVLLVAAFLPVITPNYGVFSFIVGATLMAAGVLRFRGMRKRRTDGLFFMSRTPIWGEAARGAGAVIWRRRGVVFLLVLIAAGAGFFAFASSEAIEAVLSVLAVIGLAITGLAVVAMFVAGIKSMNEGMVKKYMAQGMSEEEARKAASAATASFLIAVGAAATKAAAESQKRQRARQSQMQQQLNQISRSSQVNRSKTKKRMATSSTSSGTNRSSTQQKQASERARLERERAQESARWAAKEELRRAKEDRYLGEAQNAIDRGEL